MIRIAGGGNDLRQCRRIEPVAAQQMARRDDHALFRQRARQGHRTRRAGADISVVRPIDDEGHQVTIDEHRRDQGHVW
jgi:hypothetical protein